MTLYAFGLNIETAPVALRQRFALDETATAHLYRTLQLSASAELVLVSTCNRTEAYLYGTAADVQAVQAVLSWRAGEAWPSEHAFARQDEDALRHVLQVAAGLRSLVPGDAQILSQLKDAYRLADAHDAVGTVLHRLMHTAFRAAKRVAHETALATGAASVPTAAVVMARQHFVGATGRGFDDRRIVLVGAGQMGRLALKALRSYPLARLTVVNRSRAHAEEVAATVGAEVADWADRYRVLAEADLAIVATGAPEPVLTADALAPRPVERPLLLIDIAVPRNVEPAVDAVPGYRVLDLDDLQASVTEAREARASAVPAAEALCDEQLAEYVTWFFHQQALQPAIQAVRDTFEGIRRQEIDRHHHRFSDADRDDLDRITRSIMQKLLAIPIVRLKSTDPDSVDFVRGIRLLETLFSRPGCDDAEAPTPAERSAEAAAGFACPFASDASAAPSEPAGAPADRHQNR